MVTQLDPSTFQMETLRTWRASDHVPHGVQAPPCSDHFLQARTLPGHSAETETSSAVHMSLDLLTERLSSQRQVRVPLEDLKVAVCDLICSAYAGSVAVCFLGRWDDGFVSPGLCKIGGQL